MEEAAQLARKVVAAHHKGDAGLPAYVAQLSDEEVHGMCSLLPVLARNPTETLFTNCGGGPCGSERDVASMDVEGELPCSIDSSALFATPAVSAIVSPSLSGGQAELLSLFRVLGAHQRTRYDAIITILQLHAEGMLGGECFPLFATWRTGEGTTLRRTRHDCSLH